jgi:hypothetical protein
MKVLYVIFTLTVLVLYTMATWFGWEIASSGKRSGLRLPFITGFRGGK